MLCLWRCRQLACKAYYYLDEMDFKVKQALLSQASDSEEHAFSQLFAHYFLGYLLPPYDLFDSGKIESGLRQDDADDALITLAQDESLELISNEGWRQSGRVKPKKKSSLRIKALSKGVVVHTSKQFVRGYCLDIAALRQDFLSVYQSGIESYCEHRKDGSREHLEVLVNLYDLATTPQVLSHGDPS